MLFTNNMLLNSLLCDLLLFLNISSLVSLIPSRLGREIRTLVCGISKQARSQ